MLFYAINPKLRYDLPLITIRKLRLAFDLYFVKKKKIIDRDK